MNRKILTEYWLNNIPEGTRLVGDGEADDRIEVHLPGWAIPACYTLHGQFDFDYFMFNPFTQTPIYTHFAVMGYRDVTGDTGRIVAGVFKTQMMSGVFVFLAMVRSPEVSKCHVYVFTEKTMDILDEFPKRVLLLHNACPSEAREIVEEIKVQVSTEPDSLYDLNHVLADYRVIVQGASV
jgi:hypothetical protein